MYFACNIEGKKFQDVIDIELIYHSPQQAIRKSLKEYIVDSKTLDGNKIMRDCFPKIDDVNVFISHSHADEDIAIQLANIIYKNLGAKSFIDSMVWDYADELLKEIDNIYCMQDDGYYSYSNRNRTTSYVHMMLATSLTQMMDKCDCIIFIDTPNSLNQKILGETTTFSPWIFHELATLHTLQVKPPSLDYRLEKFASESLGRGIRAFSESKKVQIKLPVQRENLYNLTYQDIFSLKSFADSFNWDTPREKSEIILHFLYSNLESRQKKQLRIIHG